ncbi:MAG TPA: hypothetical protein VIQ80_03150 [Candidatus Saccharimonadales bacterium]
MNHDAQNQPSQDIKQPSNTSETVPSQPSLTSESSEPIKAQKPHRAKWLIPGIVAAILVVVLGSGVLAYKFWYQNPNKVISDGLMHAALAKSLTYTASVKSVQNGVTPYNFSISGISKDGANSADVTLAVASGGQTVTVKAGAVFDASGNLYVNITNLNELTKTYEAQLPASAKKVIDDFVQKVNGQWIKIDSAKVKEFSPDFAKTQQCTQDAFKKLQSDRSYATEVVDLYSAHPLFKVTKELGTKDGSLGYQIDGDQAQAKAFGEGLKNTKIYKMLHDCDSSIVANSSNTTDTTAKTTAQTTAEIWVTQWSHDISQFKLTTKESDQESTLLFQPTFNTTKTVTVPSNPKTLDTLIQDVQDLQSALMGASAAEAQAAAGATDTTGTNLFTSQL